MSQTYNRLQTIKVYEPQLPEHILLDSYNSEYTILHSPRIMYWKFNYDLSTLNQDEYNKLMGENQQGNVFDGPIEVFAIIEKSPIIQELTRMGISTIEEINISFNATQINELIGREPWPGDLMRISTVEINKQERFRFYKIGVVSPSTIVYHRYTEYFCAAENTALADIPQYVKDYLYVE